MSGKQPGQTQGGQSVFIFGVGRAKNDKGGPCWGGIYEFGENEGKALPLSTSVVAPELLGVQSCPELYFPINTPTEQSSTYLQQCGGVGEGVIN